MNNQKSTFASSKYSNVTNANGFRSMFTTWPNLFPAYTISYSAATGKPMESINNKKKIAVLLALLFLLITSLAASLMLAFLWFNAIQNESTNESSFKMSSNFVSSIDTHQNALPNTHHNHQSIDKLTNHQFNNILPNRQTDQQINQKSNQINNENHQISTSTIRSLTKESLKSSTSTTTASSEIDLTNEDDGFGEKENLGETNLPSTENSDQTNNDQINNDQHLLNYYKNMKNELDRNRSNKIRNEEKLDGDFVEHHTVSDLPDDGIGEFIQPVTSSNNLNQNFQNEPNLMSTETYSKQIQNQQQLNNEQSNLNLPTKLINLRAKQFCNLNSFVQTFTNSSYECKSNLNSNLISSYFCNDKFVIVAKINSLRETIISKQEQNENERQLISKYDVHIERILKRSPFLSVAFKKQGLTTNITINLSYLSDELSKMENNVMTCLGQRLELKIGQLNE